MSLNVICEMLNYSGRSATTTNNTASVLCMKPYIQPIILLEQPKHTADNF